MTPSPRGGSEAPASRAGAVRDQPEADRGDVVEPALGDDRASAAAAGEAFLHRAAEVVGARRRSYGAPRALFTRVAARWSLTLGVPITPAQVCLCLVDLKLARLTHDPAHLDSLVDLAGYAAVLHEVTGDDG